MNDDGKFLIALRRISGRFADTEEKAMPIDAGEVDARSLNQGHPNLEEAMTMRMYQQYAEHVLAGGDPDVQDGYTPFRG